MLENCDHVGHYTDRWQFLLKNRFRDSVLELDFTRS